MFFKIITLLCCLNSSFILNSQTNSVVIFSSTGQTFRLTVNNVQINKTEQTNVKATNLKIGWNTFTINSMINNTKVVLNDSILINEKYIDKELTFVLISDENKLYFKSVSEPSGPDIPRVPEAPKEVVPIVDNSIYGKLYKAQNNKPIFYNNYDKGKNSCEFPLSNQDLQYALNLLNKCNDDERKLVYLNSIIENNCYTTIQIAKLISVLTIEMDRLNSAKLAYSHVLDKENINLLLPSFKYQTIKDSFTSFLKENESIEKQKQLECKIPVSENKLNEIIKTIKLSNYENEKTISAKKQLTNNCINTIQAQKIVSLFTHDREKLEVLKSAYYVLVDKQNAKNLISEFQFEETRTEYLKFINK